MLEYIATVDIGFSEHSAALFDANEKFITKVDFTNINDLVKNYQLTTENSFGIVASITDSNLKDIPFKHQLARRLLLHGKFLEMPVHYSEKIHDERLVNAYFLFKQNTQKKLVIDCGNIVCADIIDQDGFQGGYILPSIQQLRNLYKFDEYFKHFYDEQKMDMLYTGDLPKDNIGSIEQGTLASFYFALKGITKQCGAEVIYLTGKYAEDVAKFIKPYAGKNNISIQLNKDLIHRSLCYIAKRVHR